MYSNIYLAQAAYRATILTATLQKGRFLFTKFPVHVISDMLAADSLSGCQLQDTPPHPPLRGPQREKPAEKLGGVEALNVLWEHMWTVCFTNPSIFETQLKPVCSLVSDILGNFQHFCLLAPFTKHGRFILGLPVITLFGKTAEKLPLDCSTAKNDICVIKKVKVTYHFTNAHTTDSDRNVAMLHWGFIRSANQQKATEKLKHFWNASLEQYQWKKISSKDFVQHS